MSIPKINERAWAIDVISEINRLSAARSRPVRSAGGEYSVAVETQETVLFPDVLLFGDPSRSAVIQGWELKMPDTPVTDGELLKKAEVKARALGLGSFLVWNVREAVLYVTVALVDRGQGRLAMSLKERAGVSREWRAEVFAWWRDASHEHPGAELWSVLAVDILLHWVHRFLFAHYLKRYISDARCVESLVLSKEPSVSQAECVFMEFSNRHDYAQLFQPRTGSEFVPKPVWTDLLAFNGFLCSMRIEEIDQYLLHTF